MNEEIQFGLGLDTTSFASNLRAARAMGKEAATNIKDSLSEMGRSMLAPFAAIASIEGVRRVLEFGEQIKRTAEISGVSAEFIQTLNAAMLKTGGSSETASKAMEKLSSLIGAARMLTPEAVKAFSELHIAIDNVDGSGKSNEQILRLVADRIAAAGSAAEKSAIATAIFGQKLGKELIPALSEGSDGLDRFGNSISKLTDAELESLSRLNVELKNAENAAMVWAGATIGFIADVSQAMGAFSTSSNKSLLKAFAISQTKGPLSALSYVLNSDESKDYFKNEEATRKAKAAAAIPGTDEATRIATLKKQLAKQEHDDRLAGVSLGEKEIQLRREQFDLQGEIAQAGENTVNGLEKRIELGKVENELAKAKVELDNKSTEEVNRRRAMQNELNRAGDSVFKANDNLADAKNRRSQLSIEDLTSSRFRFTDQLSADQQTAFQIKELERQGEWNREHGFLGDSKERFDRADKLRASLSTNVMDSERFPFKSLEESQREATNHLKEIVDKATGEGIRVDIASLPQ